MELDGNVVRGQGDDGLNLRGATSFVASLTAESCRASSGQLLQELTVAFGTTNQDSLLFGVGDDVVVASSKMAPLVNGRIESLVLDERSMPVAARIVLGPSCDRACLTGIIADASAAQADRRGALDVVQHEPLRGALLHP